MTISYGDLLYSLIFTSTICSSTFHYKLHWDIKWLCERWGQLSPQCTYSSVRKKLSIYKYWELLKTLAIYNKGQNKAMKDQEYIQHRMKPMKCTMCKPFTSSFQFLRVNMSGIPILTRFISCWGWNCVCSFRQLPPVQPNHRV